MLIRRYPTAPAQVYPFTTCLVDLLVPQVGLDTFRLPEREGVSVHVPRGQSWRGQPVYGSGNPEKARVVARSELNVFGEPWPVIVPSGSAASRLDPNHV